MKTKMRGRRQTYPWSGFPVQCSSLAFCLLFVWAGEQKKKKRSPEVARQDKQFS